MTGFGYKHPLTACPTCGRVIANTQLVRHRKTHDDPMSLFVATAEQVAEIVRLYQRHSMAEVARRTNWSLATVHRVLRAAGVQRRPAHVALTVRRVDNETLLKTAQLYGRGLTMDEVAELMGCTRSTVCRRLHSVGARTRRPGGRARVQDRRALV